MSQPVPVDEPPFGHRPSWSGVIIPMCERLARDEAEDLAKTVPGAPGTEAQEKGRRVIEALCLLRYGFGGEKDADNPVRRYLLSQEPDLDAATLMKPREATAFRGRQEWCAHTAGTESDRYERAYRCMAEWTKIRSLDRRVYTYLAEREARKLSPQPVDRSSDATE
jgi:hypothetical protein